MTATGAVMKFSVSSLEPLETRIAPAAVFTFTDVDGDEVTITTSKGTSELLQSILKLTDAGVGKRLDLVDFAALPITFNGTNLTITAEPAGGGDGQVNVGRVSALKYASSGWIALGSVVVDGDLNEIDAGAYNQKGMGLKSLRAASFGAAGYDSSDANGDGKSSIFGELGSFTITGNFGGGGNLDVFLGIGKLTVGALIGGSTESGLITAQGFIKSATLGSIEGGTGADSGSIRATKGFGTLTVRGAVEGGTGDRSGSIFSGGMDLGTLSFIQGPVGKITIEGSISGGAGVKSGRIEVFGSAGSVTVVGSLLGGSGESSGSISIIADLFGKFKPVKSLTITESVIGSAANYSTQILSGPLLKEAQIFVAGYVNKLTIGDLLKGGSGSNSGDILVTRSIKSATIGSIDEGRLLSVALGKVHVLGNITGTSSDHGVVGAETLKELLVDGNVTFGDILAGTLDEGVFVWGGPGPYSDAQIGTVLIKGNWKASNLVAGALPGMNTQYGTTDDEPIEAGLPLVFSAIKSLTIEGVVQSSGVGGASFGVVAQQIGSVRVGTTILPLTRGPANDLTPVLLAAGTDVFLKEIGF